MQRSDSIKAINTPWLSVVIIGRNEGKRLERCLQSVSAMDRAGAVEVIYVDSGSADNSVAVAEGAGARALCLPSGRPTAARGRNAGWRAASADTVLFLDGDTVLHPRFVVDAMPALAASNVAVVWGHRRELHPEASVYNRVLDLDWIYAPGFTTFCGGDALFRRAALSQTGGFDETLIAGEEPDLCRRIAADGSLIQHVNLPMTGHDLAITRLRQYWRRATRAGHAYAELAARFRTSAHPFWSAELHSNRVRALVLLSLPMAAVVFALLFRSGYPLLGATVVLMLLALRTAWRQRWKSADKTTLLLYGFHCHLQQIPIFVGTLNFERDRRVGRRAALLEYK